VVWVERGWKVGLGLRLLLCAHPRECEGGEGGCVVVLVGGMEKEVVECGFPQ
jgi:hypothetical protein